MKTKDLFKERKLIETSVVEMADAHCHLDLIQDFNVIKNSMDMGVKTIITNGVDRRSNMKSLQIADNRRIFAALGVDPEHSAAAGDDELELNIDLIKSNRGRIVAIGEIGLDYKKAVSPNLMERQRTIFSKFLKLAKDLNMPVCVHSRDALDEVLSMIGESGNDRVHIHFFEGNAQQVKEIERRGYMISVPPVKSDKRMKAIREIAIDNIMAESDAPIVGEAPVSVKRSIEMVAEAKMISFESAAGALTLNTKRFFGIHAKEGLARS